MPDLPPELAPFVANARIDLAAATNGLQPHEVIEHLETLVAKAEFEASRLGIRFDAGSPLEDEQVAGPDGTSVVVIRRLVEPDGP